jgi:hypothetical protein
MTRTGVIRSFDLPGGRKLLSIEPDAFRGAVKAAMAKQDEPRDIPRSQAETVEPERDRKR